jgi:hypothetical protein
MNFLADPELPGGVIDITRAEYEFAGSDEAEIIDNDPEPHLEEADGNDFIGAVQTEPGSVETTERYSAGDVITDANGVEVGVVVARADGSLWVRRDEVRAGVLPSDPDYPEGYGDFDYFLPIAAVVIELEAIELTGTFQGPYYDWDSFARNVGESEEYDWAAEQGWAAAQTRAAQRDLYESLSEATPDWLGSILVAQAGGTGDQIINSVDQFFAGMSSTVTGGLTNKVRAAIYGEIATQNHEGKFYTAGQIAGIAPAIAVGVMGGATVAHTGALVQFARTATAVQTAQGFYETGVKVLEGQPLSWTDALNLAPAATAGVSRAFKWVQCFEGDTAVAVELVESPLDDVAVTAGLAKGRESDDASTGIAGQANYWHGMAVVLVVSWALGECVHQARSKRSDCDCHEACDDYFGLLGRVATS